MRQFLEVFDVRWPWLWSFELKIGTLLARAHGNVYTNSDVLTFVFFCFRVTIQYGTDGRAICVMRLIGRPHNKGMQQQKQKLMSLAEMRNSDSQRWLLSTDDEYKVDTAAVNHCSSQHNIARAPQAHRQWKADKWETTENGMGQEVGKHEKRIYKLMSMTQRYVGLLWYM